MSMQQSMRMASSGGVGTFLGEIWTLYRRTLLKLVRRPVFVYFSLVQPLIWLLLFGQIFDRIARAPGFSEAFGGQSYLAFFAPAVILQTILFGAGQSGLGLINDIDSGFLSKLLTTPINRLAILLGRILGDMTRMIIQSIIILAATFVGGLRLVDGSISPSISYEYGLIGVVSALAIALLFGLTLAGMNVAIALTTRSTESTFVISNFLTFPLLFTSSAQLPLEILPGWLQVVARVNPVTYTVDALRVLLYGEAITPTGFTPVQTVVTAVVMLTLLSVVTLFLGTSRFREVVG
jgi:ABC-2 type transport system permease protein